MRRANEPLGSMASLGRARREALALSGLAGWRNTARAPGSKVGPSHDLAGGAAARDGMAGGLSGRRRHGGGAAQGCGRRVHGVGGAGTSRNDGADRNGRHNGHGRSHGHGQFNSHGDTRPKPHGHCDANRWRALSHRNQHTASDAHRANASCAQPGSGVDYCCDGRAHLRRRNAD